MTTLEPLHDVAKRLNLQARTLVKWSREGRFPRLYRYGRRWNVRTADVEAWLEACPGDPEQDEINRNYRRAAADVRVP